MRLSYATDEEREALIRAKAEEDLRPVHFEDLVDGRYVTFSYVPPHIEVAVVLQDTDGLDPPGVARGQVVTGTGTMQVVRVAGKEALQANGLWRIAVRDDRGAIAYMFRVAVSDGTFSFRLDTSKLPYGIFCIDERDFDHVQGMRVKLERPLLLKVYDA